MVATPSAAPGDHLVPEARLVQLDSIYSQLLQRHPAVEDKWLLTQTIATAPSRRALLKSLAIPSGSRVLDVGCGYGALTFEMATMGVVDAVGIDVDPEKLSVCRQASALVESNRILAVGSRVAFEEQDVCELQERPDSFDGVVSRFVLEYLADPGAAVASLARVVRPKGFCCVIDVDDGLSVTHPPLEGKVQDLFSAFATMQASKGVDRHIGRKLAGLLDSNGFDVVGVVVLPQASYGPSSPQDPGRRFLVERLSKLRAELVLHGGRPEADVEAGLHELATEPTGAVCNLEAHVAVVGRRR